jgi:hypothetical protein
MHTPDKIQPQDELPIKGVFKEPGFLLVQIFRPDDKVSSYGTVLVDIRRPGGVGGSLRAAQASIDYDWVNRRFLRCAHICLPHFANEEFTVRMEESGGQLPLVHVAYLPPNNP